MPSSIGQFSSQVVATQKEQVRKKFANLLVMQESALMKKFVGMNEKHQVSAWTAGTIGSGGVAAWRVPVLKFIGGDYQGISLDGGDLGSGSMMGTDFMTVGYFANDLAFNVPFLAMMATKTDTQAMNNTLKFLMGKTISEMALYNEIGFFQDSTGILATANGTGAPSVVAGKVTYNLEPGQFSFNRIRGQNMLVDVYDANNVQRQLGSRVFALNLSLTAPTITLSVTGTPTVANTDQIAFPGMGGTIGTSTIAAGSWRNGLYTFSTTNTSGSLLGLPYANVYELACCQVNGNNGFYTPSVIFSGASQLIQRRDDEALSGAIGICHLAQRTSWYLQGITIANQFARPGESLQSMDLAGQGARTLSKTFEAGDVTHYCSRYANKSRVDWTIPKNAGWVQLDGINFVQTPEGQRMFIGHNSSTGNPTAGVQFYTHNTRNLYSVDPGSNVVFSSLAVPAGQ
jgi:hypothetical protein